jgi:hypothetical protein
VKLPYPKRLLAKNFPEYSQEELDVLARLRNLCTKARNRDRDVEIDEFYLFDMWNKQMGRCAYSAIPLTLDTNCYNTVSLDRISSDKDYLRENVQLVCTAVNKMKQEYSEELFLHLCKSIVKYSQ